VTANASGLAIIEEDSKIRNLLLNNLLMDENQKLYEKRQV
jgi:hypothetical protein